MGTLVNRGFFSDENIKACQDSTVKLVCIPQCGGKRSSKREALEKSPEFKKGQRFRASIEGRISVLFRGRGMKRCLAEGPERFEVLVRAATKERANGFLSRLGPRPSSAHRKIFMELAAKSRLPVISGSNLDAEAGGLISYGRDP